MPVHRHEGSFGCNDEANVGDGGEVRVSAIFRPGAGEARILTSTAPATPMNKNRLSERNRFGTAEFANLIGSR